MTRREVFDTIAVAIKDRLNDAPLQQETDKVNTAFDLWEVAIRKETLGEARNAIVPKYGVIECPEGATFADGTRT